MTEFSRQQSPVGMRPGTAGQGQGPQGFGAGSSRAYIDQKAIFELTNLNTQLTEKLKDKEGEIADLRERADKGRIQKRYQQVLEENRQMRKEMASLKAREDQEESLRKVIAEQLAELQRYERQLSIVC